MGTWHQGALSVQNNSTMPWITSFQPLWMENHFDNGTCLSERDVLSWKLSIEPTHTPKQLLYSFHTSRWYILFEISHVSCWIKIPFHKKCCMCIFLKYLSSLRKKRKLAPELQCNWQPHATQCKATVVFFWNFVHCRQQNWLCGTRKMKMKDNVMFHRYKCSGDLVKFIHQHVINFHFIEQLRWKA